MFTLFKVEFIKQKVQNGHILNMILLSIKIGKIRILERALICSDPVNEINMTDAEIQEWIPGIKI